MSNPIEYFKTVPWAADLINDPTWEPVDTSTRVPKQTTEDAFFAETLNTERTIRRILTLRPRARKGGELEISQVRTILEVGPGVNGHPGLAHGGFVATLLDEVFGILIAFKLKAEKEGARNQGWETRNLPIFTAYLKTNYKKPVPTPSVLLCTATFDRREGKKIFVSGTVEDGKGLVYVTAEALFIESQPKL
jgi:acyl-coenzyme A thioesterase PaaI-like protein